MKSNKRIFTEFRMPHQSEEDKKEFEKVFDEALNKAGYNSRIEFIREKIRELINK